MRYRTVWPNGKGYIGDCRRVKRGLGSKAAKHSSTLFSPKGEEITELSVVRFLFKGENLQVGHAPRSWRQSELGQEHQTSVDMPGRCEMKPATQPTSIQAQMHLDSSLYTSAFPAKREQHADVLTGRRVGLFTGRHANALAPFLRRLPLHL